MASGRKQPSPAFLIYPQDFLASAKVSKMTVVEQRDYLFLLMRCFLAGGWISSEPEELSDAIGCEDEELESRWTRRLQRCFIEKDGMIANERLLAEIEVQEENRRRKAEAGAKGGRRGGKKSRKDESEEEEDGDAGRENSGTIAANIVDQAGVSRTQAPGSTAEASLSFHSYSVQSDPAHYNPRREEAACAPARGPSGDPPPKPAPPSPPPAPTEELDPPKPEASAPPEERPPEPPPEPERPKPRDRLAESFEAKLAAAPQATGEKPQKWRIQQLSDGRGELIGMTDAQRAKFEARFSTLAIDGPIAEWMAYHLAREAVGQARPLNLELSLWRWLEVEERKLAEGRSRHGKVSDVELAEGAPDPRLAQHRIDLGERYGSWPIDHRGWDPEQDGGERRWLWQMRKGGEIFYIDRDGWIYPSADNSVARGRLRRATLEEIFKEFPHDPAEVRHFARILRERTGERGKRLLTRFGGSSATDAALSPPDAAESRTEAQERKRDLHLEQLERMARGERPESSAPSQNGRGPTRVGEVLESVFRGRRA